MSVSGHHLINVKFQKNFFFFFCRKGSDVCVDHKYRCFKSLWVEIHFINLKSLDLHKKQMCFCFYLPQTSPNHHSSRGYFRSSDIRFLMICGFTESYTKRRLVLRRYWFPWIIGIPKQSSEPLCCFASS